MKKDILNISDSSTINISSDDTNRFTIDSNTFYIDDNSSGLSTGWYWSQPKYEYPYEDPYKDIGLGSKADQILAELAKQSGIRKLEKEENLMKVFEITVVDKKECEILSQHKVIAKDSETAMLDLDLTPEVKKKVKKGQVEFIFNELGSFERIKDKKTYEDED
jgi:hypothetical protein